MTGPSLAAGCASIFVGPDEGAVIIIDYGADASTLFAAARRLPQLGAVVSAMPSLAGVASLRVRARLPAPPGGAPLLAFQRPGWCDLTADVNFTELAGERRGGAVVWGRGRAAG